MENVARSDHDPVLAKIADQLNLIFTRGHPAANWRQRAHLGFFLDRFYESYMLDEPIVADELIEYLLKHWLPTVSGEHRAEAERVLAELHLTWDSWMFQIRWRGGVGQ